MNEPVLDADGHVTESTEQSRNISTSPAGGRRSTTGCEGVDSAPRYFALTRSFSASVILSDAQDQSTGITPSAMTR